MNQNQKHPVEKSREPARNTKNTDTNKLDLRNEIQEEYSTRPVAWPAWVFQAIQLPDDSRVLEVGSGTGSFWQQNAARIPPRWEITLTDQSMAMAQRARSNLNRSRPFMRFMDVDCQALPFPNQRFDAVLAIGVLDLVPDLDQALREIWRVLLPSGQLIASAGGKGHLRELENLLRPFLPEEVVQHLGGQEDRFGLENGQQRLSPYFKAITRRDYTDQLVFTELAPVLDYVLSEQEIAWSMPLSQLAEFVQCVERALAKTGQLSVTVRKGIFVVKKANR